MTPVSELDNSQVLAQTLVDQPRNGCCSRFLACLSRHFGFNSSNNTQVIDISRDQIATQEQQEPVEIDFDFGFQEQQERIEVREENPEARVEDVQAPQDIEIAVEQLEPVEGRARIRVTIRRDGMVLRSGKIVGVPDLYIMRLRSGKAICR